MYDVQRCLVVFLELVEIINNDTQMKDKKGMP